MKHKSLPITQNKRFVPYSTHPNPALSAKERDFFYAENINCNCPSTLKRGVHHEYF